ncbi:sensor histidine kinase [Dactylosporangium sp. CA-233914]|uniref:sensor histidine kinase n=1 Tax=Dactylosporangium sp. CA-233914 TaxID=3239934 RepID=UPI003D8CE678
MRRLGVPAGIVGVDSLLLTFAHPGPVHAWMLPVWALLVAGIVALSRRSPAAGLVAALGPAVITGGAGVLLPWSAYRAGRGTSGTTSGVWLLGAVAGMLGVVIALRPGAVVSVIVVGVVFAVVPLLVGRYLAQQEREAAAVADRERRRIARDMHDTLGHRLSLVSMQAAVLETGELPAAQRDAVRRLAEAARGAADDLHDVVGALRGSRAGLGAIPQLVAGARAAGVDVELVVRGVERGLPEEAGPVAYRVVQEGLTNGCKHAPGAPITVRAEWEDDGLVLSVVNPVGPGGAVTAGRGLLGLAERAALAGGLAGHAVNDGEFRLWAVFPAVVARRRPALVSVALAGLIFGVVPLSMLVGVA